MSLIRPIPSDTVDLMVAGEAIDSLAAAVRELVENAVDAKSERIAIQVSLESWTVSVSDDGEGMPEEALTVAAAAYSTSKLTDGASLDCVKTLGFRGEALHSLARVSHLHLLSRRQSDTNAWQANYRSDGSLERLKPAARARGTTAIAQDLFANWPARRRALSDRKRESRRLLDTVRATALAHPAIAWSLELDGKLVLRLWPASTAADLLVQLLPRLERSQLGTYCQNDLELTFGLPDRYHRHRPDWIRVAVNGRFVQLPSLQQAIQTAFRRTLPRDRHPLCLAHLRVPPDAVDWNRHPAKQELYLHNLDHYRTLLSDAIRTALAESPPSAYERSRQFLKRPTVVQDAPAPYGPSLRSLAILGQLQNTYILVETEVGLWLVEQHVAHERVRYEQLQHQWELVELAEPLLLEALSDRQQHQLDAIGVAPEVFGDGVWAIRKVPRLIASETDPIAALLDLSHCADLEAARVTLACRSAYKNGTPLDRPQMEALIRAWQTCANPHTCPHGRPIYLALDESDLSRYFRRNWTLCSQGWSGGSLPGVRKQALGDRIAGDIRNRNGGDVGDSEH